MTPRSSAVARLTSWTWRAAALAVCLVAACGPMTMGPDHPRTKQNTFAWPPPPPSDWKKLPALLKDAKTMGDVNQRLEAALDKAQYDARGYYTVPGGFALVTRLEQINDDATPRPKEQRWSTEMPRVASIGEFLLGLFTAPKGYYRVFVFVVTDQLSFDPSASAPVDGVIKWLEGGAAQLPADRLAEPLTEAHACFTLVYEFTKAKEGEPAAFRRQPHKPVRDHLTAAGLLTALGEVP